MLISLQIRWFPSLLFAYGIKLVLSWCSSIIILALSLLSNYRLTQFMVKSKTFEMPVNTAISLVKWCLNERDLNNQTSFEIILCQSYLSEPCHDKTNKMSVGPAQTQISLGVRPVWSESSLCAQWVAKDSSFLHADSEDSDQTGRMLIWVFAGRTAILLVLSRRSSSTRLGTAETLIFFFYHSKYKD